MYQSTSKNLRCIIQPNTYKPLLSLLLAFVLAVNNSGHRGSISITTILKWPVALSLIRYNESISSVLLCYVLIDTEHVLADNKLTVSLTKLPLAFFQFKI